MGHTKWDWGDMSMCCLKHVEILPHFSMEKRDIFISSSMVQNGIEPILGGNGSSGPAGANKKAMAHFFNQHFSRGNGCLPEGNYSYKPSMV